MNILYLGSPEEVSFPLKTLLSDGAKHGFKVVGVVTPQPQPSGRKLVLKDPPLATIARGLGLPVFQPKSVNEPEFTSFMQSLDVDLAITAAFGQILGSKFLATPRRAVINIHPSILPKYRGATPVQSALLDQLPSTGVTILFTVKELDAGPIIAQYPTKIAPHEKAQDLTKRMFALAAEHLIDTLLLLKNPHFDGTPQDQSAVSFCKKILKKDGLISFDRPAQYIIAQYRAYDGWPGIHTFYRNKRVNLTDVLTHPLLLSEISAEAQAAALTDPGQFYLSPTTKQLIVKASGGFIAVKALHPEGGKPQAAADFWNGIKDKNNQQSFSEG